MDCTVNLFDRWIQNVGCEISLRVIFLKDYLTLVRQPATRLSIYTNQKQLEMKFFAQEHNASYGLGIETPISRSSLKPFNHSAIRLYLSNAKQHYAPSPTTTLNNIIYYTSLCAITCDHTSVNTIKRDYEQPLATKHLTIEHSHHHSTLHTIAYHYILSCHAVTPHWPSLYANTYHLIRPSRNFSSNHYTQMHIISANH